MSHQLSAQAITAHTAITRISSRRCSILPQQRGSSTVPKCCTRVSMDMARLLAVARAGHHASGPVRRAKSHAQPLGATRSHAQRSEHGEHRTFPAASTRASSLPVMTESVTAAETLPKSMGGRNILDRQFHEECCLYYLLARAASAAQPAEVLRTMSLCAAEVRATPGIMHREDFMQ